MADIFNKAKPIVDFTYELEIENYLSFLHGSFELKIN